MSVSQNVLPSRWIARRSLGDLPWVLTAAGYMNFDLALAPLAVAEFELEKNKRLIYLVKMCVYIVLERIFDFCLFPVGFVL